MSKKKFLSLLTNNTSRLRIKANKHTDWLLSAKCIGIVKYFLFTAQHLYSGKQCWTNDLVLNSTLKQFNISKFDFNIEKKVSFRFKYLRIIAAELLQKNSLLAAFNFLHEAPRLQCIKLKVIDMLFNECSVRTLTNGAITNDDTDKFGKETIAEYVFLTIG